MKIDHASIAVNAGCSDAISYNVSEWPRRLHWEHINIREGYDIADELSWKIISVLDSNRDHDAVEEATKL
jgi:hypothetical protein